MSKPLREGEEWADGARPIATILLRQLAWDLRNLIGNFHLTETGHEMKDEVDERWGKLADALGLDLDWLWADERPSDPMEKLELHEETQPPLCGTMEPELVDQLVAEADRKAAEREENRA